MDSGLQRPGVLLDLGKEAKNLAVSTFWKVEVLTGNTRDPICVQFRVCGIGSRPFKPGSFIVMQGCVLPGPKPSDQGESQGMPLELGQKEKCRMTVGHSAAKLKQVPAEGRERGINVET